MTAIRAVVPAAEEVVVICNILAMLFGNHAEGVGYRPLFGCTKLAAALWLLGLGLDDVFVGRLGELLRSFGIIVSNEVADLDGILVIQNKLRVSYWNSSFVGKQGHPRAVGKYMPICVGLPIL